VRVETRDALAAAAQTVGLSLSGYLDDLAAKEWRERALAELREERIAAFQDPTFVAEMEQWHAADDGMELTDDGWPEFND
jgi:predicted DsbA family dithiol-disulfide isomerase